MKSEVGMKLQELIQAIIDKVRWLVRDTDDYHNWDKLLLCGTK